MIITVFGLVLLLLVLLVTAVYLNSSLYKINVIKYTVRIDNLPPAFDGFTILHITDLHSKHYGESQEKLLNIVSEQQFDIIALTGDLVDRSNPILEPTADLLAGLANSEIFYVCGNHDIWAGYKDLEELLIKHNVTTLNNRSELITRNGAHIWMVGVDDPFLRMARLGQALENVSENATTVLLAHSPNIYEEAVEKEINLVLVGHTHGGQIRLPFIGALFVPGQGFFPQYDYGLYSSGVTTMIINAGLGESGLPIRINTQPEILIITLEAAQVTR